MDSSTKKKDDERKSAKGGDSETTETQESGAQIAPGVGTIVEPNNTTRPTELASADGGTRPDGNDVTTAPSQKRPVMQGGALYTDFTREVIQSANPTERPGLTDAVKISSIRDPGREVVALLDDRNQVNFDPITDSSMVLDGVARISLQGLVSFKRFEPLRILNTLGTATSATPPHTSSGYEDASLDLATAELVYYSTTSEAVQNSGLYDEINKTFTSKTPTNSIVNKIYSLTLSAIQKAMSMATIFTSKEQNTVTAYANDSINNLFGKRRVVPGKKNPVATIAATLMSAVPESEFNEANVPGANAALMLGIHQSETIAGCRNLVHHTLEVMPTHQAFGSKFAERIARTDNLLLLNQLAAGLIPPGGSVTVSRVFHDRKPEMFHDPEGTREDLRYAMLCVYASPQMRTKADDLATRIFRLSSYFYNPDRASAATTNLSGSVGAAVISLPISDPGSNLMTMLLMHEVSPMLSELTIEGIESLTTGFVSLGDLILSLSWFVLFPNIAHACAHTLVPRICSILNGTETFRRYLMTNGYSANSHSVRYIDKERFYTKRDIPRIMVEAPKGYNQNSLVYRLYELFSSRGQVISPVREWGNEITISTAANYVHPNGNHTLQGRFSKLIEIINVLVGDRQFVGERRNQSSLNSLAATMSSLLSDAERRLHLGLGAPMNMIASTPIAAFPTDTDIVTGTGSFPVQIIREGVPIDSYRKNISIPLNAAFSVLMAGDSTMLNWDGSIKSGFTASTSELFECLKLEVSMMTSARRAAAANMATNMACEFASKSVSQLCPLREDGSREWVTASMKNLTHGAATYVVPSQASNDIITGPIMPEQITSVRPVPSAAIASVMTEIDGIFGGTSFLDMITTGGNTHTAGFLTKGYQMRLRGKPADVYFRDIRLTEPLVTEYFAANMRSEFEVSPLNLDSRFAKGMVLAQRRVKTVDRLGMIDASFKLGPYIDKPREGTRRVYLISSFGTSLANIPPATYPYLGMFSMGGIDTMTRTVGFSQSSTVALYLYDRSEGDANIRDTDRWKRWTNDINIILTSASATPLKVSLPGIYEAFLQCLVEGGSNNEEPGSFIYHDTETLFPLPASCLTGPPSPTGDDITFYTGTEGYAVVPKMYDEAMYLRSTGVVNGQSMKTIVNFIHAEATKKSIMAIRPGISDVTLGGDRLYEYNRYHKQMDPQPFFAMTDGNGNPVNAYASAVPELTGMRKQLTHNVCVWNEDSIADLETEGRYHINATSGY